jgi:23S rRNA (adenine2503-C2)-methyltransferase
MMKTKVLSQNILDLTVDELKRQFHGLGVEPYRADQVFRWIYEKGIYDFDQMTNLSLDLRRTFKESFLISLPEVTERQRSEDDKSVKLLLRLKPKDFVETVYMTSGTRRTVCVSSQVGCKFHCAFCASGQQGFFRNLTMGEMVSQVLLARDISPDKKITNLVFMGIGEPLDNYMEILKTIRTLNSKPALGIGARKITLSTCGLVPKIEALGKEGLQVELSVSLHGPNDTVRGAVMPVNRAYPVKTLIAACKKYTQKTKRAITFEYLLIDGVNASIKEAIGLTKLLKGILCKVNLIPYNSIEEFPHVAPSYPNIVAFQKTLQEKGIIATVRFSKGQDIQAACGQLRSTRQKAEAGRRKE